MQPVVGPPATTPNDLRQQSVPAQAQTQPASTGAQPHKMLPVNPSNPPGPAHYMPPLVGKMGPSMGYTAMHPYASMQQTASSQRDTQITPPTRLYSSQPMAGEKDEYLLKLLGRGRPSSAQQPSTTLQTATAVHFRAPDPVPSKGHLQLAGPSSGAGPATASNQERPVNQGGETDATQHGAATTLPPNEACWSFADTQRRMGTDVATQLRDSVVAHQIMFIEQIYDLHRAMAVQKLLVRNCPEVAEVITEASRLLQKSGQHTSKRMKRGRPYEPGALRPESQFAAVPLPGDTATATGDGSGDDADGSRGNGSGGNGSGGGSTSPQPQAQAAPPLLLRPGIPHLPHIAAAAAPSGASASPLVVAGAMPGGHAGFYPRLMAPPPPPWAGGMAQMNGYPGVMAPGGTAPSYPGMMGDPMAWWYQTYYGQRQAPGAQLQVPGMPPLPPSAQQGMVPPSQAAAAGQPQANAAAAAKAAKWWQDPQRVFGPPGDPEALAQLVGTVEDARQEVESAPPSEQRQQQQRAKAASVGQRRSMYSEDGPGGTEAGRSTRRVRRKPADPIEEASSGTTGLGAAHAAAHMIQDDAVGGKKGNAPGSPKVARTPADANVAQLLLSMGRREQC